MSWELATGALQWELGRDLGGLPPGYSETAFGLARPGQIALLSSREVGRQRLNFAALLRSPLHPGKATALLREKVLFLTRYSLPGGHRIAEIALDRRDYSPASGETVEVDSRVCPAGALLWRWHRSTQSGDPAPLLNLCDPTLQQRRTFALPQGNGGVPPAVEFETVETATDGTAVGVGRIPLGRPPDPNLWIVAW
jgi:hypothetical protein